MKKRNTIKVTLAILLAAQGASFQAIQALEENESKIVEETSVREEALNETLTEELVEEKKTLEELYEEATIETESYHKEETVEISEAVIEEEVMIQPHAVLTGSFGDIDWSFDDQSGVLHLGAGTLERTAIRNNIATELGIASEDITEIYLDGVITVADTGVVSGNLSLFFSDLPNLKAIHNLETMDVSKVGWFTEMFLNTSRLESVNVSWADTSTMRTSYGMFRDSGISEIIGMETWDTSRLEVLDYMFTDTVNLEFIDVSWSQTDRIFSLEATFAGTGARMIKGIENWNVSDVYTTRWMFASVENMERIHLPWNTMNNLLDAYGMFMDSGFMYITGMETWQMPVADNIDAIFAGTYNLEEVEFGVLEHPYIVDSVAQMFEDSGIKRVIGIEKWDMSNIAVTAWMFNHTPNLERLNLDWKDTFKNVQMAQVMFSDSGIEHIEGIENWDVSSLEDVSFMFYQTPNLKEVDITWPHGQSIIYGYQAMFKESGVKKVVGMKDWDIQMMTNFYTMFEGSSIEEVELPSKFDFQYLGNSNMFKNAHELRQITINDATPGFDTLIKGSEIPERSDDKFTGRWISNHTVPLEYSNSADFMLNGGYVAGVYSREYHNYSVTYEIGDGVGSVPAPKLDWHKDDVVTLDFNTVPTKVGHKFIGWKEGANVYTDVDDTLIMPARDVVFIPVFELESYPVKFIADNIEINAGNIRYGDLIAEPVAPEVEGHTFKGWYHDEDYTQVWDFAVDTIQEETSIYARYDINHYNVNFMVDGNVYRLNNIAYGEKLEALVPSIKQAYTFVGWFKDEALTQAWDFDQDVVKGDVSLYSKWKKNDVKPDEDNDNNSNNKGDSTEKDNQKGHESKTPQTGIDTQMEIFSVIMVTGFALVTILKRKKQQL